MVLKPEDYLYRIVDSSEDAIIGEDLGGAITLWNDAAERMFGRARGEMLGQPGESLVPPALRPHERQLIARAARGERIEHYETTRITKDGRTLDVSLTLSPIRDRDGTLVGVSRIVRDITERKRIDAQAMHLVAVVQSSEDAIVSKDLDGVVRSWNPAAERLFGYTAGEMIGQSIRRIIPAERWDEEDDLLRRVRVGHRVQHFETVRQRKDGSLLPIALTVSPIHDARGNVIGASKVARDMTRQRSLERESRRLGAIVDSSDDAIISKDLNGVVQSWNRAAERMFGFTPEEAIGRSITMIIPEERLGEEDEVLGRIRRGLRVDHFETVRRRKDGTLIPISLSVSPIVDRSGQVVGASKIARDLSALRAYATTLEQTVRERTAELETANTQLESFAYSVSHDLRAPLRGMQGLAHALLEDYGPTLDATARDYAGRIVAEASHLDRLIRDLLAYSRLTRIDVALERVDVREAIDDALHQLDDDIRTSGATVDVEPGMPLLRANRTVLVQVLSNLISNAIKFGGERPTVRVRAELLNGTARVWVEDQGIGIAPKHQERIFRAFERLHGADHYTGTGIGLAIVHKGIERLGGRVGVESQEGKGSRFWFELPRAEAA